MDYIQSQQVRDLATNGSFDYRWEEIKMDEHQLWFPDDLCVSILYSSSSTPLYVFLSLMLYFKNSKSPPAKMFMNLYIVVVSCYSHLTSYFLAWRATFIHSEVSSRSSSQTFLSRLESFLIVASPGENIPFWFWKVSDLSPSVLAEAWLGEMSRLRLAWREWWFLLMFFHAWASLLACWVSFRLGLARCSPGEHVGCFLSCFVFQSWLIVKIPAQ